MANSILSLNYKVCRPDLCDRGICRAAEACPLHILRQEEPFDFPMTNSSPCKGCAKCASACPQGAIALR